MSDERQTDRCEVLKKGLALGGIAAIAGMPFWSKLALVQGEVLVPFTDMPEDYSAPPVTPGGIHFLDTLFNFDWRDATPGEHSLVSRVTDVNGQVQATVDQMPEKPSRWENYAQFTRTVMIS